MGCLFCELPETGKYKSPKDTEYVCSDCTQLFIRMSQDTLRGGINFLEDNKEKLCVFNFEIIENKIKALKMFVGEEHEQRRPTRYNQRTADRKRTAGAIRDKKGIPGLLETRKKPPIS